MSPLEEPPGSKTSEEGVPISDTGSLGGRDVTTGATEALAINPLLVTMSGAIENKEALFKSLQTKVRDLKVPQTTVEAEKKEDLIAKALGDINFLKEDLKNLQAVTNDPKKVDLKKLRSLIKDTVQHIKNNSEHIAGIIETGIVDSKDESTLHEVDTLYEATEYLLSNVMPKSDKDFLNFRKANLNHNVWYIIRPLFFGTETWKEAKGKIAEVAKSANKIVELSKTTTETLKKSSANSLEGAQYMAELTSDIADVLGQMTDVKLGKGSPVTVSWDTTWQIPSAGEVLKKLDTVIEKHKKVRDKVKEKKDLNDLEIFLTAEIETLESIQTQLGEFITKTKYLPLIAGGVMAAVSASLLAAITVGGCLFPPSLLVSIPALVIVLGVLVVARGIFYKAGIAKVPVIIPAD